MTVVVLLFLVTYKNYFFDRAFQIHMLNIYLLGYNEIMGKRETPLSALTYKRKINISKAARREKYPIFAPVSHNAELLH